MIKTWQLEDQKKRLFLDLRRRNFFLLVREHNYTVTPSIRLCYSGDVSLTLMAKIMELKHADRVVYVNKILELRK